MEVGEGSVGRVPSRQACADPLRRSASAALGFRTAGTRLGLFLAVVAFALTTTSPSQAGKTFDFEFHDREYLLAGQHRGGRAYVPKQVNADEPVPLVVFLHGINRQRQLHPWLRTGRDDLRKALDKWLQQDNVPPAVIAGPSQTRHARSGRTLWDGIDLDEFVMAAERAVKGRARIARDQVIVAGHSGAGCNASGGLLRIAAARGTIRPMGIVAIDTCLDAEVGEALARADESTRIGAYWQSVMWDRKLADFAIGFQLARPAAPPGTDWFGEVIPLGRRPHDALVAPSLFEAISVLIRPSEVHDALAEDTSLAESGDLADPPELTR
jgi:hypothetical protein